VTPEFRQALERKGRKDRPLRVSPHRIDRIGWRSRPRRASILAQTRTCNPRCSAIAQEPRNARFVADPATTIAVLTLALCALQTQVDIPMGQEEGLAH